jgi:hypothetical protein
VEPIILKERAATVTPNTSPPVEARETSVPETEALQPTTPAAVVPPPAPAPEPPVVPAAPKPDIERPMCFYLGREYDLATKKVLEKAVMYDARDLTTHGVVVGMTGSGKTGLCISILEEAAIDGIPSIIIDPKGDLCNLLLQFPDLKPEDFREWINPQEAKREQKSPEQYAEEQAASWQKGLEESLQSSQRIRLLQESSEWRIYTPGSEAGLPLSVLKNFAAPEGNILREQLNQRIDAMTTALLGLTGITADPLQSREHILIAQLLLNAWSRGKSLDLPELIAQIQNPPLSRIGAFDVETFYPEKDRLELAIALNNILAAPSFSTWIEGETLDLSCMLFTSEGKPRQLIFYIAHLEESQRIFFVTLLLEEVLNWTRKQTGTSTLRALLYFDEVFGYLPPYPANPPTKLPLMTMLKQARAFGVGVLLATQNPVDIDYKALSNAGTWFVGKLQTERDKARLIEGLEGVAAEQGSLSNRGYLETVISALGRRVFLLHDVHRGKPVILQTRHALSFLGGPMTRDQVARLMKPVKEKLAGPAVGDVVPAAPAALPVAEQCPKCNAELQPSWKFCPFDATPLAGTAVRVANQAFKRGLQAEGPEKVAVTARPQGPPEVPDEVPQFYLPLNSPARPAEAGLIYRPRVLAVAEVIFQERKVDLYFPRKYHLLTEAPAPGQSPAWHASERLESAPAGVSVAAASWEDVPEALQSARSLKVLEKSLIDYLHADAKLILKENKELELTSNPGEDLLAFVSRCRLAAQKEIAKVLADEKNKFRPKFAALGARLPETTAPPNRQEASVLTALNPLSWMGWGSKPKAPENEKVARLQEEWFARVQGLVDTWKRAAEEHEDILVKLRKKDIQVLQLGLAWVPFWQISSGAGVERVAAYR